MIHNGLIVVIISWSILSRFVDVSTGQMQSPCPGVFDYYQNASTREIEGRIEIRDVPQGIAAHIKAELSIAAVLPTNYVGQLELGTTRNQAVTAILQHKPLIYRMRFPLQRPLPFVTRIVFNGREYCTGRRAIGRFVTSITLEHTLFPPGVARPQEMVPTKTPKPPPYPNLVFDGDERPAVSGSASNTQTPNVDTNYRPPTYTTTRPTRPPPTITVPAPEPSHNLTPERGSGSFSECGRPKKQRVNFLVSKGDRIEPGDWPWLVAIFVSRLKLEFQCAANLITAKHVLTAAHCLKSGSGTVLPANTLLAVFGRYRLRNWAERGSVTYEVADFKIHEDYGQTASKYDSDIAIVTLMETVTFDKLILPICLWSGPQEIEPIVGQTGIIVGWGRDHNGNPVTVEPRMSKQPVVSQEECLRSNADFLKITSNRTFCAGKKDGSGPCNGDSGGGFVMYDSQDKRYHLRGIVSLSLLDRDTGACDLSEFVVYTDIAQYADWIQAKIRF